MDYQQEQFSGMQENQSPKLPFYMTYPMQNVLFEEAEYEKDISRLKGMYPKEVRTILYYVEEECDKMEYEGSLMFDEYPDRLMLKQISNRIYQKVTQDQENMKASEIEDLEAEELRMTGYGFEGRGPFFPERREFFDRGWGVDNLINVLLFNEMHNRRCRHRRCRRWW